MVIFIVTFCFRQSEPNVAGVLVADNRGLCVFSEFMSYYHN